jgi:hypothetical protein
MKIRSVGRKIIEGLELRYGECAALNGCLREPRAQKFSILFIYMEQPQRTGLIIQSYN